MCPKMPPSLYPACILYSWLHGGVLRPDYDQMLEKIQNQIRINTTVYIVKFKKRCFRIDQQLARHFMHTRVNVVTIPLAFFTTQIINPLNTLRLLANHDKGLVFQVIVAYLYSLMFLQCKSSFSSRHTHIRTQKNTEYTFIIIL